MSGLIDSATSILLSNERRLEVISNNITNASTPGYKTQYLFSQIFENMNSQERNDVASVFSAPIMSQGAIRETGNPLDLAIVGSAMFLVRQGSDYYYSRSGQFSRNEDGNLINAQNMILQQVGGGDLTIENDNIEVLGDGTVINEGRPIASIGLYNINSDEGRAMPLIGGSMFEAQIEDLVDAEDSNIRQGMMEASNVELSDEMIAMTKTVREAETGARLVQIYDQMIGQAISRFGGGR